MALFGINLSDVLSEIEYVEVLEAQEEGGGVRIVVSLLLRLCVH